MSRVVDCGIVEEDEVLCGIAAAHLESARAVALALDAGQELYGFDDVALAHQSRHFCHFGHLYVFNANNHVFGAAASVLGGYIYLGYFFGILVHCDSYLLAARIEGLVQRRVAQAIERECCGHLLHLDDEIALGIGDGSVGSTLLRHRNKRKRVALGVNHDTLNLSRLSRNKQRHQHNQN